MNEVLRALKQACADLSKRKASITKRTEQKAAEVKKQEEKLKAKLVKEEAKKTERAAKNAEKARSVALPNQLQSTSAWAAFTLEWKHHLDVSHCAATSFNADVVDWGMPYYIKQVAMC